MFSLSTAYPLPRPGPAAIASACAVCDCEPHTPVCAVCVRVLPQNIHVYRSTTPNQFYRVGVCLCGICLFLSLGLPHTPVYVCVCVLCVCLCAVSLLHVLLDDPGHPCVSLGYV